jgi:hypothetical protein
LSQWGAIQQAFENATGPNNAIARTLRQLDATQQAFENATGPSGAIARTLRQLAATQQALEGGFGNNNRLWLSIEPIPLNWLPIGCQRAQAVPTELSDTTSK